MDVKTLDVGNNGTMTVFLLKLTLAWGFFALLYALLLKQETFFRANRFYLLGTAVLGILLASPIAWAADKTTLPIAILPSVTVGMQQAEAAASQWEWLDYLWIVYWAGAGLAVLRMLWGFFRIAQMVACGEKKPLPDRCILVNTAQAEVPFSFFNWVFVPSEIKFSESCQLSESYASEAMLAHERAHARGWHSADVLLAEILCTIFWFHPLAHWYRRSLRAVHEYLADADASRRTDKKQYGLLLIRQAQQGMPLVFVNHFFQSPLKQRIIMLTRNASPMLRAWKYGLVLPVFILLFLFACQKTTQEQLAPLPNLSARPEMKTFELADLEQQPQFPGGMEALAKFVSENIRYPETAAREGAEGVINLVFVIDEKGKINEVENVAPAPSGQRQDFKDEAIRVLKSMPDWTPGMRKGTPVKVKLTLPVRYRLK